ncbi:hypothetical protein MRX96_016411 [Rhipicephalus microplus]
MFPSSSSTDRNAVRATREEERGGGAQPRHTHALRLAVHQRGGRRRRIGFECHRTRHFDRHWPGWLVRRTTPSHAHPNCGPGEYAAEEVEECSPSPFFHTFILAMDTLPHHNLTTSLWYPFLWNPCCCLESSVDGRVSKAKLCHRSSHRRCRGRIQRAGKQFRCAAAGLRGL